MFQCQFLLLPRSWHLQHLQGPSGFCVQCHEAHWVFISFSASIRVPLTSGFKGILTCFRSFLIAVPHLGASPTWWTQVWASSGSWWWTGKPGVLQSMGSQRVRFDWATKLNLIFNISICASYLLLTNCSRDHPKPSDSKQHFLCSQVCVGASLSEWAQLISSPVASARMSWRWGPVIWRLVHAHVWQLDLAFGRDIRWGGQWGHWHVLSMWPCFFTACCLILRVGFPTEQNSEAI